MMSALTYILAQTEPIDRYNAMRQGITRNAGGEGVQTVAFALIFIVAAIGLAALLRRVLKRRAASSNSPKRLFHQAVAHLNLAAEDVRFLSKLAVSSGLAHPSVMLLSPQLLAAAATQASGSPALDDQNYRHCDRICRRLFNQSLPNVASTAVLPTAPLQ